MTDKVTEILESLANIHTCKICGHAFEDDGYDTCVDCDSIPTCIYCGVEKASVNSDCDCGGVQIDLDTDRRYDF